MKFFKFLTLIFIPLVVISVPDLVSAQGLASVCEGNACNACHIISLISTVTNWLITLLMVIFAIMVVSAGFGLVTSAGNVSAKEVAKKKMTNAIIGLVIVLAAWLIIDTIMRALLAGGTGQIDGRLWSTITCGSQTGSSSATMSSSASSGASLENITTGSGSVIETQDDGTIIITPASGPATFESVAPGVTPDTVANLADGTTVVTYTDGTVVTVDPAGAVSTASIALPSSTAVTTTNSAAPASVTCGPANGGTFTAEPASALLCVAPSTASWIQQNPQTLPATNASGVPIARYYQWSCTGVSSICQAEYSEIGLGAPADCGPAEDEVGVDDLSGFMSDLCEVGSNAYFLSSYGDAAGNDGEFNWECVSDSDSTDIVQCAVDKNIYNTCGYGYEDTSTSYAASIPAVDERCAYGNDTVTDATGSGGDYNWYCSGESGPIDYCHAVIPGVTECGTSVDTVQCEADGWAGVSGTKCGSGATVVTEDTVGTDGHYNWSCTAADSVPTSCSAEVVDCSAYVAGCGSVTSLSDVDNLTAYTSSLCQSGNTANFGSVTGDAVGTDGDFNWECISDIDSSDVAFCSVDKTVYNECYPGFSITDSSYGVVMPAEEYRCSQGSSVVIDGTAASGEFKWNCTGEAGPDASCHAVLPVGAECGPAEDDYPCDSGTFSDLNASELCEFASYMIPTDTTADDGEYNWQCFSAEGFPTTCSVSTVDCSGG